MAPTVVLQPTGQLASGYPVPLGVTHRPRSRSRSVSYSGESRRSPSHHRRSSPRLTEHYYPSRPPSPHGVHGLVPTETHPGVTSEARTGVPPEARTGVPPEARTGVPPEARTGVPPEARTGILPEDRAGTVPTGRHTVSTRSTSLPPGGTLTRRPTVVEIPERGATGPESISIRPAPEPYPAHHVGSDGEWHFFFILIYNIEC
jgi:hypothetical protein